MVFETIIWDWNGTLLDDVAIAVDSINKLLYRRGLNEISIEKYLEVFTFPVQEYYQKIGFDLEIEPFEIVAHQFIEIYDKAVDICTLHEGVETTLGDFHQAGCRQFILSAMEQNQLERTVSYNGISHYFEELSGLGNHYARSKVENGLTLISRRKLNLSSTLMIGDTIHDAEVARTIGCKCILIANGHQSKTTLETSGATVLNNLHELVKYINLL